MLSTRSTRTRRDVQKPPRSPTSTATTHISRSQPSSDEPTHPESTVAPPRRVAVRLPAESLQGLALRHAERGPFGIRQEPAPELGDERRRESSTRTDEPQPRDPARARRNGPPRPRSRPSRSATPPRCHLRRRLARVWNTADERDVSDRPRAPRGRPPAEAARGDSGIERGAKRTCTPRARRPDHQRSRTTGPPPATTGRAATRRRSERRSRWRAPRTDILRPRRVRRRTDRPETQPPRRHRATADSPRSSALESAASVVCAMRSASASTSARSASSDAERS